MQALVIADCYENKFVPLHNPKTPMCLLPLANVPVLHYVIEMLLINEIRDIIIVTGTHRDAIKKFVQDQGYKKVIKIDVKKLSNDAKSIGDALREAH